MENPVTQRRAGRVAPYWLLVLLVFLVAGAWALANPLLAAPDEPTQIVHAEAVARGEILGTPVRQGHDPTLPMMHSNDPNMWVYVPGVLQNVNSIEYWCFIFDTEHTPNCGPPMTGPHHLIRMETYVGRYPPLYYLAVSGPSLIDPGRPGILGMRLASALLNALLLSAALAIALRRSRVASFGVLVAATPTVFYYAGSINPNGFEIAAAICAWCAFVELALPSDTPPRRWLVIVAAVSGSALALARGLSPAWLAVAVLAAVAVGDRKRLGALSRRRVAQLSGLATMFATVLAIGWIVGAHALYELSIPVLRRTGEVEMVRVAVSWTPRYLEQMVGVFGANNIPAPPFTTTAWIVALAILVVSALWISTWRSRLVMLAIAAAIVVVPIGADLLGAHRYGYIWLGRYTLPLGVGLPILAGHLCARPVRRPPFLRRLPAVAVAGAFALAAGQVAAIWWDLRRFMVGSSGSLLGIFHGTWRPPVPGFVLVLAVAVGAFGLALSVLKATDSPYREIST